MGSSRNDNDTQCESGKATRLRRNGDAPNGLKLLALDPGAPTTGDRQSAVLADLEVLARLLDFAG